MNELKVEMELNLMKSSLNRLGISVGVFIERFPAIDDGDGLSFTT